MSKSGDWAIDEENRRLCHAANCMTDSGDCGVKGGCNSEIVRLRTELDEAYILIRRLNEALKYKREDQKP